MTSNRVATSGGFKERKPALTYLKVSHKATEIDPTKVATSLRISKQNQHIFVWKGFRSFMILQKIKPRLNIISMYGVFICQTTQFCREIDQLHYTPEFFSMVHLKITQLKRKIISHPPPWLCVPTVHFPGCKYLRERSMDFSGSLKRW